VKPLKQAKAGAARQQSQTQLSCPQHPAAVLGPALHPHLGHAAEVAIPNGIAHKKAGPIEAGFS